MKATGFCAYPDGYLLIGPTLEAGVGQFNDRSTEVTVKTWKETDVAGRFISSEVLGSISRADFLVADISYLNFNVTFEIGYAIGRGKPVLLTMLAAVSASKPDIDEIGIFDTIGYERYNNRDDVSRLLAGC